MDNNEVVTEEVAAVVENNTGIEIEPLFEEQVDFDTFSKSDFRVVKVKNCEAVPKSKKLLRFTLDDGTENERTILSGVHAFYEPEELVGKTLLAIVNLPPRSMMGIDSCGNDDIAGRYTGFDSRTASGNAGTCDGSVLSSAGKTCRFSGRLSGLSCGIAYTAVW